MEQQHRIKKQIIEIRVRDRRNVSALQEEISELYHGSIVPYINVCCNSLSPPGMHHKIELLELDIGTVNPHFLTAEFEEKLKPVLYRQLAEKIRAVPPVFSMEQPEAAEESGARAKKAGTDMELLSYFIQTGLLPWWAEKHDKLSLEKTLEAQIIANPGRVKALFLAGMENADSFKRFILHFSDTALLNIAGLMVPGLFPFLKNYRDDLQQLIEAGVFKSIARTRLRLEQWKGLLLNVSYNTFTASQKEILAEQHLMHLAAGLKTDYTAMILSMTTYLTRLQKDKRSFKSGLPQIINGIHKRLTTKKNARNETFKRETGKNSHSRPAAKPADHRPGKAPQNAASAVLPSGIFRSGARAHKKPSAGNTAINSHGKSAGSPEKHL